MMTSSTHVIETISGKDVSNTPPKRNIPLGFSPCQFENDLGLSIAVPVCPLRPTSSESTTTAHSSPVLILPLYDSSSFYILGLLPLMDPCRSFWKFHLTKRSKTKTHRNQFSTNFVVSTSSSAELIGGDIPRYSTFLPELRKEAPTTFSGDIKYH